MLLRLTPFTVLLFFLSSFSQATIAKDQDLTPLVVIDRIQISESSGISPVAAESILDIPIRVELTPMDVALRLQDAKMRLEATGQYKKVDIKLAKSETPRHFILDADLPLASNQYIGLLAKFSYSPYLDNWTCSCSDQEKEDSKLKSAHFGAYVGSRNFRETGWALDLELSSRLNSGTYDASSNMTDYSYSLSERFNFRDMSLGATAIQQNLFDGHLYAGGLLTSSLGRLENKIEYHHQTSPSATNASKMSADHSNRRDRSAFTAGVIAGFKFNNLTLAARWIRKRSHNFITRDNEDYFISIDNQSQPQEGNFFRYAEHPKPVYSNEFVSTLAYSQKPKLNLVEGGLDSYVSWQRYYTNEGNDFPSILAHAEYTWLIQNQYGLSGIADMLWRRNLTYLNSDTQRIFQIGARLDVIKSPSMIAYGEFSRAGARRHDIGFNPVENKSRYVMRNRFDIGVQYASPELLYAFSFVYGVEPISEILEMNHQQFQRLGVH